MPRPVPTAAGKEDTVVTVVMEILAPLVLKVTVMAVVKVMEVVMLMPVLTMPVLKPVPAPMLENKV